jgi:acetoin utilization deacetylase AcuC-like enzyme
VQVFHSPRHRLHDPGHEVQNGVATPVNDVPERADAIRAALEADGGFTIHEALAHGRAPIEAVHDPDLVAYLAGAWQAWARELPDVPDAIPEMFPNPALREGMGPFRPPRTPLGRLGHYGFDTSTPLAAGTYEAARSAVDVALTALEAVLGGEPVAYGLCRPPGHHAPRAAYGGFCFFNNAAIAAEQAVRAGVARVAVLDVDYHHGNGTQQIFYGRGDVLFVSLHADPDRAYPYLTGFADETGTGRGLGANRNILVPEGCDDATFLALLGDALEAVAAFGPELVVVSLGVDTYALDPLGDLAVTTAAFTASGAAVSSLGVPMVVLQEGGYHLGDLGANVLAWLRGAEGR